MKSLHELIHNLSQTEKRYVKLRLKASKSESELTKHFDELSSIDRYESSMFFLGKDKTPKLVQSNLSKLYKTILKLLRQYHSAKSSESIIQGFLADIELLQDKGMIKSAMKLNDKAMVIAEKEEVFDLLKKTYYNNWMLHHLTGTLNDSTTQYIEAQINACRSKENELEDLSYLYRSATTIYYKYFFSNRNPALQKEIQNLELDSKWKKEEEITSDRARHIYFEIRSMQAMVNGNILSHHEFRKKQLYMLFDSQVFEKNYMSKLMVLSNVFTYLKSTESITELKYYIDFMNQYFKNIISKSADKVLMEKFYDIYFQNNLFLQLFEPHKLEQLESEASEAFEIALKSNNLLVSRTLLSFAEINIVHGNFKKAINFLIEFHNTTKDKKHSKLYIESELHYLAIHFALEKIDVFENAIRSLLNKIKNHNIFLDAEQQTLLDCFKAIQKDQKIDISYLEKIKYKQSYRIYIHSMIHRTSIKESRRALIQNRQTDFHSEKDHLLKLLNTKL